MKRAALISLLVLAGCGSEEVRDSDVAFAQAQCESNDGLKTVKVLKVRVRDQVRSAKLDIQCWNGASFEPIANSRP